MMELSKIVNSDFWKWVKNTFTADYRKEIESYLSESIDYFDLQRRISVLRTRGMI
jgi:hypothetical protein